VGISSHFHQTTHGNGKIPVDFFPLWEISEFPRPFFHGRTPPLDIPTSPWDQARDGLQESRLASSIWTNQRYSVPAGSSHRNIPEGNYRSIGNLNVPYNQLVMVIVVRTAIVFAGGVYFQGFNNAK